MKNSWKSCDSVDLKSCLNKKLIISTCVRRTVKLALNFYTYCIFTLLRFWFGYSHSARLFGKQRRCPLLTSIQHLLYRGCLSTLESTAVSNFIYFYTFHGLKQVAETRGQNPLQDLLFACIAGIQYTYNNNKVAETRGQNPLQDLLFACIAGRGVTKIFVFIISRKFSRNFNFMFRNFLLVSRNFRETRNQNLDKISVISRNFLTKFSWFRETSTNFY